MDNLEFETLSSAEFKEYMQTHKEKNYLVIDVRQASEYEEGHIPGAKLMPLSEVETRLFTLPSERDLIFYCANGGRSQWAASLAGEAEVSEKTVYHFDRIYQRLAGEILEGGHNFEETCRHLDAVRKHGCTAVIDLAMAIEYSAFELYRTMVERSENPAARSAFLSIAQAEKAHMRALTRAIDQCPENNHQ